MQQLRFIDVLNSSLPNSLGLCTGDTATLASIVNESQLRLIHDPLQPDEGWWGTYARTAFTLDTANKSITLPRQFARVTGLTVCRRPVVIRNEFWETMEFGNGLMPPACGENCQVLTVYGRGMVPTFKDLPKTSNLRVYISNEADVGKRILLQGIDQNSVTIRTQDGLSPVLGEYVDLANPLANAANLFSKITGIQKDVTYGDVQVFAVDPDTGDETLLLTMEPSEQTASYQRYFLNGLPESCCGSDSVTVEGIAKLDYIPISVPTDYLIIQSLLAIIEESRSSRFATMDIPNAFGLAKQHHDMALAYLAGLSNHMVGKERISISVPLFNSDRLRLQPR